ncbi:MAG: DUF1905 domain-containing protein [Sphingobacteriales bacterium]|nr:DUF1905 domain-containing protein [Sphingobacteriales bacterium]OJY84683.1 MAG: hypothetical protein BGP14_21770 [Sphingobacteriales bacterium 44-15]
MEVKYKTTIAQTGNNTGIHVPEPILEKLNGGKKPLVKVMLNGYAYRSAVGKMGDRFMISLSAENRKNAGVNGGDTLEVTLALDTEPRIVELPAELQAALNKNKKAKAGFEKLAPGRKKAIALSVTEAKTEETKMKRIEKAINDLAG